MKKVILFLVVCITTTQIMQSSQTPPVHNITQPPSYDDCQMSAMPSVASSMDDQSLIVHPSSSSLPTNPTTDSSSTTTNNSSNPQASTISLDFSSKRAVTITYDADNNSDDEEHSPLKKNMSCDSIFEETVFLPEQANHHKGDNHHDQQNNTHPQQTTCTYAEQLQPFIDNNYFEELHPPEKQLPIPRLLSITTAKELKKFNSIFKRLEANRRHYLPETLQELFYPGCQGRECRPNECKCPLHILRCLTVLDIFERNEEHRKLFQLLDQDQEYADQRKARWTEIALKQATRERQLEKLKRIVDFTEYSDFRSHIDQKVLQNAQSEKQELEKSQGYYY